MAKYIVQWDYVAGKVGPYFKGDVIEIKDDDLAAWMNRDSPGVLVPVTSPLMHAKASNPGEGKKKKDRMMKAPLWDRQGGPNDGVEEQRGPMTKADFKAVKD